MNINHIAIWTSKLNQCTCFYERYFCGKAGDVYINESKQFRSIFISFSNGCRLELMQNPNLKTKPSGEFQTTGFHHIAFSVGSRERVDKLTEIIRRDGYTVVSEPRTTGDGYYESVVLDPDGNRIEITE